MEDIDGKLTIDSKIWFNDSNGRCRLRICGFSKEQIEKMKNSTFIDITFVNMKGMQCKALVSISVPE